MLTVTKRCIASGTYYTAHISGLFVTAAEFPIQPGECYAVRTVKQLEQVSVKGLMAVTRITHNTP